MTMFLEVPHLIRMNLCYIFECTCVDREIFATAACQTCLRFLPQELRQPREEKQDTVRGLN